MKVIEMLGLFLDKQTIISAPGQTAYLWPVLWPYLVVVLPAVDQEYTGEDGVEQKLSNKCLQVLDKEDK